MAEAFLSAVSKSDYNFQLSVKFLGICQLSVTVLATTQHKTSWTFSVYYKCNYIRTIKLCS